MKKGLTITAIIIAGAAIYSSVITQFPIFLIGIPVAFLFALFAFSSKRIDYAQGDIVKYRAKLNTPGGALYAENCGMYDGFTYPIIAVWDSANGTPIVELANGYLFFASDPAFSIVE